jgi:HlyD family secretion protein
MTRTTKVVVTGVVALGVVGASASLWWRGSDLPTVAAETLRRRDLEAVVSASGKIQPKRQVNLSANTMGRVTRLAVQEGEYVREGQFLLEIDPRSLEGQLQRGEASVATARSALLQTGATVEQARATLELTRRNLRRQEELWAEGLTSRESLERAQNEVAVHEAEFRTREQEMLTREEQIKQEQASLATTQYNMSQVTISSPMDGMVTRRNIEEGENVMVGTMNNAGTVLLTIADMSVIESEIEVDETDIPEVTLAQEARVTIDAVPNQTFRGHVTEIGNSPIQTAGGNPSTAQATNFKVIITLDEEVPGVRPGFTCTAEITTATRRNVVSVPIQAVTVREMLYDEAGTLVHEPPPPAPSRFRLFRRPANEAIVEVPEAPPGHTRMETEGVFVVRDGRAMFAPIALGIAGERYFEILSGVTETDQVITGPFATVRELADGSLVALRDARGDP